MKYRGAISGGEVDLFLFDVEERGNLLFHGTTPFVHLYIRIHTCLDVRIMLTHYWRYTQNETTSSFEERIQFFRSNARVFPFVKYLCSDTLSCMYTYKYIYIHMSWTSEQTCEVRSALADSCKQTNTGLH